MPKGRRADVNPERVLSRRRNSTTGKERRYKRDGDRPDWPFGRARGIYGSSFASTSDSCFVRTFVSILLGLYSTLTDSFFTRTGEDEELEEDEAEADGVTRRSAFKEAVTEDC